MNTQSESTTVYHLEMCNRDESRPSSALPGFEIALNTPPTALLNRHFYQAVGELWEWTDRLEWSENEWHTYVHRTALETWVGRFHGQSAGYFELELQEKGNVEIKYFGLLPEFIGHGLVDGCLRRRSNVLGNSENATSLGPHLYERSRARPRQLPQTWI